jgi:subtilisin family serine protease
MDDHGHGTHVAGIIASSDAHFTGVAPEATIMAVKVLSAEGRGTYESVLAGVEWAVRNGAGVINISLGGAGGFGTSALAQAVDNAMKSGVVVAVAAGNAGPDMETISTPGDSRLGITVGSVRKDRVLSWWSSRGPTLDGRTKPDVVAYGDMIWSSVPGGGFEEMSGTSMATPHVAGIAALLVQDRKPDPLLVKEALRRTATDLGYGQNWQGAGLIDLPAALHYLNRALNRVRQEVNPGETAVFEYTLFNRGNVDDTYRITQWLDDQSLKQKAGGTDGSIGTLSQVPVASGDSVQGKARVRIAEDWAGMADTVYVFHLQATSLAKGRAADEDRATLKVKATKRSMAEYIREELEEIRAEIRLLETDGNTKRSLWQRADETLEEHLQALESIKRSDEPGANRALDAAAQKTDAMDREIRDAEGSGRLTAADAQELRERVRAAREHILLCRKTSLKR